MFLTDPSTAPHSTFPRRRAADMAFPHHPILHRAPRANLPRSVYRWTMPDGSVCLFAIDSRGKLIAIAPPSAEGVAYLWRFLNDHDPQTASEARAVSGYPAPVLPPVTGPHLALVR